MRVARYEVPGKIGKSGPSRGTIDPVVPPGLPAPREGYCGQWSHLVFSMGLAAKLKASAAPLMRYVSSCRLSQRRT
jgi:hypothetical protein